MINITTKYAVRAIEALASEKGDSFIPIGRISESSDVAAPYLAKILKTLASRGLIESKKGLNGGFRLNRSGSELTLYDVALCLDDPVTRPTCFIEKSGCNAKKPCAYHKHWSKVNDSIKHFLQTLTL